VVIYSVCTYIQIPTAFYACRRMEQLLLYLELEYFDFFFQLITIYHQPID